MHLFDLLGSNGVVHHLCPGTEEVFLDTHNVETLISLEGFKPLASDPALIQVQGLPAIILPFSWVQL